MSWTKESDYRAMVANPNHAEAAIREHRNYWKQAVYSTAPANRKEIESYVEKFYRDELKLDCPKCLWIDSPGQAIYRGAQKGTGHDFDTYNIIDAKFNAANVEVEKHIPFQLRDGLREALAGLRDPLFINRHSPIWRYPHPDRAVHLNSRAPAYMDFFVTKIGFFKSLKPWLSVLASCGGIWFRKETIVLLDTPATLRADDHDRLHCENGPALRYRDGREFYCLHGVCVPATYVLAEATSISLTQILRERNAEVRLALISKVGFSCLLETVRHWTISEAHGNSLLEFRIKGVQFIRALHVRWHDKTGQKETVIPVPSRRSEFGPDCPEDIDDCEQVRRWTLGWPKEALAVAET